VTHVNLNDGTVEGLAAPAHYAFSVQYHPEATPGPHDSLHLFERFGAEMRRFAAGPEHAAAGVG
jgi:carbamoyl-phosphate synthase small subunit